MLDDLDRLIFDKDKESDNRLKDRFRQSKIYARLLRGKDESDFIYLTEKDAIDTRPFVLWVDGIEAISWFHQPVEQSLDAIGWSAELIDAYIDRELRVLFVTFDERIDLATWPNVITAALDYAQVNKHKNAYQAILRYRDELITQDFDDYMSPRSKRLTYNELDRLSDPTLSDVRALFLSLGFYREYSGDGWTKNNNKDSRYREYLTRNLKVDTFENKKIFNLKSSTT